MNRPKETKVYPTNWIIRAFVFIFFTFFAWRYKIKKRMPSEVKSLKPPYLVLGNHVGFWDPFVAGNFLPHFIHFVSSDVAFSNPAFGFFLTRLGTIPKKKNVRDTKVIRDIIAVIRQGECVGIYPEAVRNWAGSNFPIDPSIAKLIKMLQVPVVVPKLQGMNLFNPRWSKKLRHTRVLVDYSLLFTKSDILESSLTEIHTKLSHAIKHDEVEYQRTAQVRIRSKVMAEHISHALYVCPQCHGIDTFICKGNLFKCHNCQYDIEINSYSFFERISSGTLYFDNIRDWYYWQEDFLIQMMIRKLKERFSEPVFADKSSEVFVGQDGRFISMGRADASLFIDRIEFAFELKEKLIMNYDDLLTINPQVNERLEILYKDQAYRVVGARDGVSALKWEVAVNAIWRELGQNHKLSPYIGA